MDNNIDYAEAMIEVCKQVMEDRPHNEPITWPDLLKALEEYIITERHEIERLRKLKYDK